MVDTGLQNVGPMKTTRVHSIAEVTDVHMPNQRRLSSHMVGWLPLASGRCCVALRTVA